MNSKINNVLDVSSFGLNLYWLMEEKGYTREGLAKEIGVTPRMIYSYLSNQKWPTVATLVAIANVLDVSLDDILRKA